MKISIGGEAARAVVDRLQPAPLCQRNKTAERDGEHITQNTRVWSSHGHGTARNIYERRRAATTG
eukprot:1820539-Karenia_brevis.AAC.1